MTDSSEIYKSVVSIFILLVKLVCGITKSEVLINEFKEAKPELLTAWIAVGIILPVTPREIHLDYFYIIVFNTYQI